MSSIPKIIWQTSQFEVDNLPPWLQFYSKTWQINNPDWDYRYQSNKSFAAYLEKTYSEDVAKKFFNLPGSFKADFWRFYVLSERGGVYSDIDTICYKPISPFFSYVADFSLVLSSISDGHTTYYQNWFIAAKSGNVDIERARNVFFKLVFEDESFDGRLLANVWDSSIKLGGEQESVFSFFGHCLSFDGSEIVRHLFGSQVWSDVGFDKNFVEKSFWDHPSNLSFIRSKGI